MSDDKKRKYNLRSLKKNKKQKITESSSLSDLNKESKESVLSESESDDEFVLSSSESDVSEELSESEEIPEIEIEDDQINIIYNESDLSESEADVSEENSDVDTTLVLERILNKLKNNDDVIESEVKNLSSEEKKIYETLKEPKQIITLKDIINSPVNKEKKADLISIYKFLNKSEKGTVDYTISYNFIKKELKNAKESGISLQEIDKLTSLEEKLKNESVHNKNILSRILESENYLGPKIMRSVYDKFLALQETPVSSSSYASLKEWIDETIKIPFENIKEPIKISSVEKFLLNAKEKLDQNLLGLSSVKEAILCLLNNSMTMKSNSPLFIAMIGNAGTGKTEIARSLADILNLPFEQISLGGMTDSSILDGQGTGWLGSRPGAIVRALQKMKCRNGVIFLDEIDKLGNTSHGIEVQHSLLRILDTTQNIEFKDNYIGQDFSINLKDIVFVVAMNSTKDMDPALLSRLPLIHVPDYSIEEKISILKKYMLPKVTRDMNFNIILTDDVCKHIISMSEKRKGKEGGVRNIRDLLVEVVNKISLIKNISLEKRNEIKLFENVTLLIENENIIINTKLIDVLCEKNVNNDMYSWKGLSMYL